MIPFLSLKDITESFQPELSERIRKVVDSGWYLLGEEKKRFEVEFASFCGTRHCIGVANGLDALILIFQAYKELGVLADGDEVIVPANTYIASILAVTACNLKPVLVEPDISTYLIDTARIREKITRATKAIMVVHLYGQTVNMEPVLSMGKEYNLRIIEDSAQSHGSLLNGRRSGSLGDASGFSFYPGKNLGCLGDGGAVTTDDDDLAFLVGTLANYGSEKKYICNYRGRNSRLDEIQAAVLSVKLPRLDRDNEKRREIAFFYRKNIRNPNIILPSIGSEETHVWHVFPILCKDRTRLQSFLRENGIQTLIHYPVPPHKQNAYREWNHLSYPITERIHEEELSLPISPTLKQNEMEKIVDVVNEFH